MVLPVLFVDGRENMRHNKKEKAIVKSAKSISATKRERRFFRTGLLFASPWLIGFICFTIVPILLAFYYSFTDYNLFTSPTWVGLKNYIDMFHDPYVGLSLKNTLFMVIIGTPAELIVALCLALLLNQKKVFGLPVFRTIFYLPTLVPVVASAMLFMWVLNGNYGLINQILDLFGIDGPYWLNDPKWTKVSLIVTCFAVRGRRDGWCRRHYPILSHYPALYIAHGGVQPPDGNDLPVPVFQPGICICQPYGHGRFHRRRTRQFHVVLLSVPVSAVVTVI